MREGFLSTEEMLFLQKEKRSLNDALSTLSSFPLPADDLAKLRSAIEQLGGEPPEREFYDDPEYEALFGLQEDQGT